MKISSIAIALFSLTVGVESRRESASANVNHARGASSQQAGSYYRHLHDVLQINEDDPNQDIRTNIILNMEGL